MRRLKPKGQAMIEYLILVSLIAISTIWVVSTVGKNLAEQYGNISHAITRGDGRRVTPTQLDTEALKGRGMDDFMSGARKVE